MYITNVVYYLRKWAVAHWLVARHALFVSGEVPHDVYQH